jgi:hypothetical protein
MENGGHVVHHTLSFMDEFEAQKDEQWRERLVKGQVRVGTCVWLWAALRVLLAIFTVTICLC